MALYTEFKGTAIEARNAARKKLLDTAASELNLSREQLVVRPLRANDIGLGGGTWSTLAVGTTLTEYTNATIADNVFLSIYGFSMQPADFGNTSANLFSGSVEQTQVLSPIQEMKITRKGSASRFYNVAAVPFWPSKTAWFDDPVTVDQNTNLTIEFVAASAATLHQELHAFHGDVVEKRGITINP